MIPFSLGIITGGIVFGWLAFFIAWGMAKDRFYRLGREDAARVDDDLRSLAKAEPRYPSFIFGRLNAKLPVAGVEYAGNRERGAA